MENKISHLETDHAYKWLGLVALLTSAFGFSVHLVYFVKAAEGSASPLLIWGLAILLSLMLEIGLRGFAPQFADALTCKAAWAKQRRLVTALGALGFVMFAVMYVVTADSGSKLMGAATNGKKPSVPLAVMRIDSSMNVAANGQVQAIMAAATAKTLAITSKAKEAARQKPWLAKRIMAKANQDVAKVEEKAQGKIADIQGKAADNIAAATLATTNATLAATNLSSKNLDVWVGEVQDKSGMLRWLSIISMLVCTISLIARRSIENEHSLHKEADPALQAIPNGVHNLIGGLAIAGSEPLNRAGNYLRQFNTHQLDINAVHVPVHAVPQNTQMPHAAGFGLSLPSPTSTIEMSDDDKKERRLVRLHLEKKGYTIPEAEAILNCLKACKQNYKRIGTGTAQEKYNHRCSVLAKHGIIMNGYNATIQA
jgi:hypothetical protein